MSTRAIQHLKRATEALFQAWLESDDPSTEVEISELWRSCRKLVPGPMTIVIHGESLAVPNDTETDVRPPEFDPAHTEEEMIRDLSFGGSL